jgi:hypothetical protein
MNIKSAPANEIVGWKWKDLNNVILFFIIIYILTHSLFIFLSTTTTKNS